MLLLHTCCSNCLHDDKHNKAHARIAMAKTSVANLVRNTASGVHYARVRIKGKLIWKSLKLTPLMWQNFVWDNYVDLV
jgi:hypothetical protein